MNFNQIINMVMRIIMRRAISSGVNAGINAAGKGLKRRKAGKEQRPAVEDYRDAPDRQQAALAPGQDDDARRKAERRAVRQARRSARANSD